MFSCNAHISINKGGCSSYVFDKDMTMKKHVQKMCKSRNIAKIPESLEKESVKTAVNALVTPHLDYRNGLLYNISKKLVNKLGKSCSKLCISLDRAIE